MNKANELRELINSAGIKIGPGIYDCLGAKIAEKLGFKLVFTSGFGISGSTLGKPDYGLLTATEMLYTVGRIVRSISIPLIADADTGYGNPLNVIRTVSDFVQLGIAGLILEDQQWPKKCGHMDGKRLISKSEHVEKIRAAVEARAESGLVIIARTDALAPLGLDQAIERGRAYFEAGADVIFIEAPQTLKELKAIAQAFTDVPLFANMVEGGKTPFLSAQELEELGFKLVAFPLSGLFAATAAMMTCLTYLKNHGTTEGVSVEMVDFKEYEKLIDLDQIKKTESEYIDN
ncbi:2,3-dimethylmalate lyase [uncultured Desulfobacterium sp.]|uniref:2,3-dimethylmalate lyase n=1 Tax=uncultured Desulfobacterium sp. TaxID=201089 RepID=A0A445N398_9BACT|nr:2,3-dimethylmalate lyase [uncultured Desulfobacterium sp.]